MKIIISLFTVVIALTGLSGCVVFQYGAYTNTDEKTPQSAAPSQTSFFIRDKREAKHCTDKKLASPKRQKDVLVLLAFSGGGSRAAYFSALSMLEMQKIKFTVGGEESDLLHEVDVISSVSGGSLAAGYYAISADPGAECASETGRTWNVDNDAEIRELMTRDYRDRWLGNWFWPNNIFSFWFSNFDRTDIMARTLANSLFSGKADGTDLRLGELNALRPNLILNATTGSRGSGDEKNISFGHVFTFTDEDFARICSSVQEYSAARAVMATATFPGAFNFMTLRNYCPNGSKDVRHLHVFDGGNGDNLGLTSLKRVIWDTLEDRDRKPTTTYKRIIVVQVDSFTFSRGASPNDADPRAFLDYFLDTNVADATDSLLEANRENILSDYQSHRIFRFDSAARSEENATCRNFFHVDADKYCTKGASYWEELNKEVGGKLTFVHLAFERVGSVTGCQDRDGLPSRAGNCLEQQLNRIPTDFKFRTARDLHTQLTDVEAIACAVAALFSRDVTKNCGAIRPVFPERAAQVWDEVRRILQNPDAANVIAVGSANSASKK